MKEHGDQDEVTRLFTLRGIAYIILLIGNAFSLYVAGSFKGRYPRPKNVSDFALFFKNVKISQEEFALELKEKYPHLEIKELFAIRRLEPFYSSYQKKL